MSNTSWTQRAAAVAALAAGLTSCAADAVPVPDPEVETPGAFVTFELSSGKLALLRTRGSAPLENGDSLIVFILYDVEPVSFDDAARLAREPSLPTRVPRFFYEASRVYSADHAVVWFRTLSAGE